MKATFKIATLKVAKKIEPKSYAQKKNQLQNKSLCKINLLNTKSQNKRSSFLPSFFSEETVTK
jgi:hypothetical protein